MHSGAKEGIAFRYQYPEMVRSIKMSRVLKGGKWNRGRRCIDVPVVRGMKMLRGPQGCLVELKMILH